MLRIECPNKKPLRLAVPNVKTSDTTSTFVYYFVNRDTKHIRTIA